MVSTINKKLHVNKENRNKLKIKHKYENRTIFYRHKIVYCKAHLNWLPPQKKKCNRCLPAN